MKQHKAVLFTCNWESYSGLETAGEGRLSYPAGILPVTVSCLGEINPGLILKAFENGADGVMLLGCPPGNCHYEFGNRKAEEVFKQVRDLAVLLGLRESQLELDWVAAADGQALVQKITKFMSNLNGRRERR